MAFLTVNSIKFNSAENEGLCPICGEVMKEVDRMKEGPHFFIWFKCRIENCYGQWLQKRPVRQAQPMMMVNNQEKELTIGGNQFCPSVPSSELELIH